MSDRGAANPQKEHGYTPIANEILDAVLMRKFTKRQDRILIIVWRFSYGFNKKVAYLERLKDFNMYGISPTVISKELLELERLGVLAVDWDTGEVAFVKNYNTWGVLLNAEFDMNQHKRLLRHNIHQKDRSHKGWNSSRRGGGRPSLGSQSDNLQKDIRLLKMKPTGYESSNLRTT